MLALLAIFLVISALAWQYFKPAPPTRVTQVEPVVQNLSTTLDLNAVVVNTQTVTITALLNGEIGEINAREGMQVAAGAPLATLDNERTQSLLDKASAELAYTGQKLKTAERSYSRMKNLSGAGNASKQSLDDSLDTFRSAQTKLAVAKADVKLAELQLKNANVTAPFAGVIIEQFVEAGQWVEAGTPLFEVAATDSYLIEAQVDASDWARVSLNQTVYLSAESAPDVQWQSAVSWIAPTIAQNERDAKAVAIRFEYGKDAPPLLLGQEVDAELVLEQVDSVLTLPLSAMIEQQPGENAVFTSVNNKAALQTVSVGLQNATHAEILEGLDENDAVITSQGVRLEENMVVEIR